MDLWAVVMIAGLGGFGLGALVVWWIERKKAGGSSVSALKKEHEQFREQVTSHFVETAELINRLTDSYKDVFDHLSKGAETLVDDKSLRDRMPQVSDQEVRLKRIGTRSSHGSGKADAPKPGKQSRPQGGSSSPPSAAPVTKAQASRSSDASSIVKDKAESGGSAQTAVRPLTDKQAKTGSRADSKNDSESSSEADSESKSGSESDSRSDRETEPKSQTGPRAGEPIQSHKKPGSSSR